MAKLGRKADGRPLKRKIETRRPKKTLVVFCEGEKTEPQYLQAPKNGAIFPDDNPSSGMHRLIASIQPA
jgi:hypothetical protein